jgi:regulatory protein YycH of two-component signal transduction system YycFG
MSYTDPAAPPSGEASSSKDILAAVDFVNEHGGWNGVYRLELSGNGKEQSQIVFQQYYGSYPVLDRMNFHYGMMKMELQQGNVSAYERSLIYMQGQQTKRMKKLPGGEELKAMVMALNKESPVEELYPAYLPELESNSLRLIPVWAVKLENGQIRTIGL